MKSASDTALNRADSIASRVRGRDAPIRKSFIRRPKPMASDPPQALMLRGGRGGDVRLKLYLSMIWNAAKEPFDVDHTARGWAELLDLPKPETNGARRISDAIGWLDANGFVKSERRPGRPSRVLLLEESGQGIPYQRPAESLKEAVDDFAKEQHFYMRLPATFWTGGWAAALSGRATAALLALLSDLCTGELDDPQAWFSPNRWRDRFALSEDTRRLGFRELEAHGLIAITRQRVNAHVFDQGRFRNSYTLLEKNLLKRC